ncbi:hypothetical protein ACN2WE_30735 [Streptomyces sp. cg28]|uniref:hypothetical protein n=1 Tax=Streptomyces sp. cg28 TaxID=3403457 RepID=UPI003B20EF6A
MTADQTMPSAGDALFDVPTPIEEMLRLAVDFTRHNDALDIALRAKNSTPDTAHSSSARDLAADVLKVLRAIHNQRLHPSEDLTRAHLRLRQLAFLAEASADHPPGAARELTALATKTVMDNALIVAEQTLNAQSKTLHSEGSGLTAAHKSALVEIARGHVVANSTLGREYTRSSGSKVPMSTLRRLEAKHLVTRTSGTALPAYYGGPLQDRVQLTPAGITALAAALTRPAAVRTAPRVAGVPLASPSQATARSR